MKANMEVEKDMSKQALTSQSQIAAASSSLLLIKSQYSQIRSSILLLFSVVLIFICFLYFDIIQFDPNGGLVLNISSISSFTHHKIQFSGVNAVNEDDMVDSEDDGTYVLRPPINPRPRECNLLNGSWVYDESYLPYSPKSCPFIDEGFRCQENGRPDHEYMKWRWQPLECDMPRFNGEDMLEQLRGKRLVFVGDSLGRNQWESMLCLLADSVINKTRIYEVNGEPITKHKGFLIFRFEEYNCTVEYYRSPFLVPQVRPPPGSPEAVRTTIVVDNMDWTCKYWLGADIIVFNAGHWWSYEKTKRSGGYFQEQGHANMSMTVKEGFTRAMQTWREWVTINIDPKKTQLFFRTYAPVHFSGGTWKTGGACNEETEPYPSETRKFRKEPWTNAIILEEFQKFPEPRHPILLDITFLSFFRKDGHPSIYNIGVNKTHPTNHQDCSHWCLPGLPDTWNYILYSHIRGHEKLTNLTKFN